LTLTHIKQIATFAPAPLIERPQFCCQTLLKVDFTASTESKACNGKRYQLQPLKSKLCGLCAAAE